MECVKGIGVNMDLRFNLEYIVENPDETEKLATVLTTNNVSVKKQVFELLGALCVYNKDGFLRALQVFEHYKKIRKERYRFKLIVDELLNDKNCNYLTAVFTFVNCSIIACKTLKNRIRLRNEYLGLRILDAITRLRILFGGQADCELFVQVDLFEEQRLADECQLTGPDGVDLNNHQDIFYAILRQVSQSPQEIPFLNILQHLLRIDTSLAISDIIWDTAEKLVHRATLCETKEDSEKLLRTPSYHHSLNKLLRGLQESGGRCQCSCHAHNDSTNDSRTRKRTPLQLSLWPTEVPKAPGLLSPSVSSIAFNTELLASLSRAISPPPRVPPPPPPPPKNVVDTPPLPPPFCSNLGLPPPPPPPPNGIKQKEPLPKIEPDVRLPQQFTPKPKNKMKTLNWTKISTNKVVGKNNLWYQIAKAHESSPNNLDFDAIEGLFCQQSSVTTSGQASPRLGSDSLERKRREPSEINLLDGKRSLNVNIFLKQFRSSNEEIIEILTKGAHGEIGAEKLRGLLKIFPESDEIELLRGYTGERQKLGKAEKFLLQLIELPNYKLRCEAMLLKEEFASNMSYLEPAIETIEAAAEELQHCQELHEVLYMLLVAGNFLNSGSYAGDAAGFKIMSLLKVTEMRANKPGMNLIHYVVQEAENKFSNLLNFPDQLQNLEEASKLSIDNLKTEIANLSNRVSKISHQVAVAGKDIKLQMDEFLELATRETSSVQKEIEHLEEVRREMADFLCEDLQSFKLEESFKIFQNFCQTFRAAKEENERRRQQEKRAEERRKQREELSLKKRNSSEKRPSSFSGSESDNMMDMLLGVKGRSWKEAPPAELTSEEEGVRRRIGSSNSVACGDVDGSPDITPNGTLRRRRRRLSSEDKEDNLMDYLRSTLDTDSGKIGDGGSLDRSWFRRSRRRKGGDLLCVERERPASPLAGSDGSRPKQWRLNIEEWLQENEKDKDKTTLHETKTDSEIYSCKAKQLSEEMPFKDKSKWRKSNLNVANSSESIDEERRRSRGRKNPPTDETITFYMRSPPMLENNNSSQLQNSLVLDPTQDRNCGPKGIVQSNSVPSTQSPLNAREENGKDLSRIQMNQGNFDSSQNVCENRDEGTTQKTPSDKDAEGNFDRFSSMRKTTRRLKVRPKQTEHEIKTISDEQEANRTYREIQKTENIACDGQQRKVCEFSDHTKSESVENALQAIDQCNKDIQTLKDDNVKPRVGIFSKYSSDKDKMHENEEQRKKEKSLKARLSKRLLSLTENLKVVTKSSDSIDAKSKKDDKKCGSLDSRLQILQNEANSVSTSNPRDTPLNSETLDYNSFNICKPQMLKETYVSDTNTVKVAHATPLEHEMKFIEVCSSKGKEESEKDEGFEETQSQLSEAASQGAGSSYDTDLADSPRSLREIKATAEQNTKSSNTNELRNLESNSEIPRTIPLNRRETENNFLTDKFLSLTENPHVQINDKQKKKTVKTSKSPMVDSRQSVLMLTSHDNTKNDGGKLARNASLRDSKTKVSKVDPKTGHRVPYYTKAIKAMTNNLRDFDKTEKYDVTQSMPPTPSEEKKTFISGLNTKTRSALSVCNPRYEYRRLSEDAKINSTNRRESDKSIASKRSSDRSLNLSRKSSEASVVTVKSANIRNTLPRQQGRKPPQTISLTRELTKPSQPKNSLQSKQTRVPTVNKSNSLTKSLPRSTNIVRRDKVVCGFMKATSASTAKTTPFKLAQEQSQPKTQKMTAKPYPSINKVKHR